MSGSSARSALCELSSQNENPSLESETTTSPHVESPKGFHEERTISHPANQLAARQRVQRHISGAVFILNNPPSSAAVQEAVMAELNEEGSGRPILNRAANETWRKRRRSE